MWRKSFVTRLSILSSLVVAGVILMYGLLLNGGRRDELFASQGAEVRHRLDLIRIKVQTYVHSITGDIRFLSKTPALKDLVTSPEGPQRQAAEDQLRPLFRALLEERPNYFQARLISVAEKGREWVRLDNVNGQLIEVRGADLQDKGDRDYYQDSLKLAAGQFYLSDINLNQERGKISEPYTPTLRASTLLHSAAGEPVGVLVLNVDVSNLFREIATLTGSGIDIFLCNAQGDYLMHPRSDRTFAFDLGGRANIFDDYSIRHAWADKTDPVGVAETPQEIIHMRRLGLEEGNPKQLLLALDYSKESLLARWRAQRDSSLLLTLGVAAAAVGGLLLVTHFFARRLRQVSAAMERYAPGQQAMDLPEDSGDEAGLVIRRFREMSAKIEEQVGALEDARHRAEEATQLREELMATMTHEIRTPLNAVLGMTHLLEQSGPSAGQQEWIRTLKFSGQHLMALLNNVLDSERILGGHVALDAVDFDLDELLGNLHRGHIPIARRREIDLAMEKPRALGRVVGDPVRLYQILNNLLHNALKFTQTGGVTLGAERRGTQMHFCVRDTGPGLPAEVAAIFAAGPEADHTGHGLGLRISRRLVHLLGGKLEASTGTDGRGTVLEFSLSLPEVLDAAPAAGPTFQIQGPDLSGKTILLVDDTLSNQAVTTGLLAPTRCRLLTAGSLAEAREVARREPFDAALVDLQLPDGSGLDFIREWSAHPSQVVLLGFSADSSVAGRAACLEAGAAGFLLKPAGQAQLFQSLTAALADDAPNLGAVAALFDREPSKVREYLMLLRREFDGFARAVPNLAGAGDGAGLHRLHHRMKNALGQLNLTELDQALTDGAEAHAARQAWPWDVLASRLRRVATRLHQAAESVSW